MDNTNLDRLTKLVFFNEGDIVRLKLPGSPDMIVKEIVRNADASDSRQRLKGIRCQWFSQDGKLNRNIFNTKDLELVTAVVRVHVSGHTFTEAAGE